MKPAAPCSSARRITLGSSRADTTITGSCGCARAQVHQRAEAVRAGHVEVEQQQVGVGMRLDHRVQRLDAVGFDAGARRGSSAPPRPQRLAEQRMVVGDEDGGRGTAAWSKRHRGDVAHSG